MTTKLRMTTVAILMLISLSFMGWQQTLINRYEKLTSKQVNDFRLQQQETTRVLKLLQTCRTLRHSPLDRVIEQALRQTRTAQYQTMKAIQYLKICQGKKVVYEKIAKRCIMTKKEKDRLNSLRRFYGRTKNSR